MGAAQGRHGHLTDRRAVDEDLSRGGLEKAREQAGQGGLAGTHATDDGKQSGKRFGC